jgi:hypothetical protein
MQGTIPKTMFWYVPVTAVVNDAELAREACNASCATLGRKKLRELKRQQRSVQQAQALKDRMAQ